MTVIKRIMHQSEGVLLSWDRSKDRSIGKPVMKLRGMMYEGMALRGYDYKESMRATITEQMIPIN